MNIRGIARSVGHGLAGAVGLIGTEVAMNRAIGTPTVKGAVPLGYQNLVGGVLALLLGGVLARKSGILGSVGLGMSVNGGTHLLADLVARTDKFHGLAAKTDWNLWMV